MHVTKLKIIETTLSVILEKGLEGLATARIAASAGIATGTLFHHFKDKADILRHTYTFCMNDHAWNMMGFFDYPKDQVTKTIKRAIAHSIDYWRTRPAHLGFVQQIYASTYYDEQTASEEFNILDRQWGHVFHYAMEKQLIREIDYSFLLLYVFRSTLLLATALSRIPESERVQMKELSQGLLWNAIFQGDAE